MRTFEEHLDRKRARRAAAVAFLLILVLLLGLAIGAVFVLRTFLGTGDDDYAGPGTGSVVVVVKPGDNTTTIARTLVDGDVVKSASSFRDAATAADADTSIQPGSYRLRHQMAAADAVTLLLEPSSRVERSVTVREGLRLAETYAALAKGTEEPAADYTAAAKALELPAYAKGPEGLLFPATYKFDPTTGPADQLAALVKRYRQAAASTGLDDGVTIGKKHYTPYQVLVVASILEKEARNPADMAKVARVLYNRLDDGMRLQLDSTVSYATGKPGVTTTAKDRQTSSPYNTYARGGLPPGPIDSPGEAAMAAARHPTPGSWTYFVAVNLETGQTKFATTKAAHDRNVAEFRAWLQAHPQ